MATYRGTVQKLGLEGGLWALVTEKGETLELLDPPEALKRAGARAEIDADDQVADVSIGMVGRAVEVRGFKWLDE